MKQLVPHFILALCAIIFSGCGQKDQPTPTGTGRTVNSGAYFFSNTEWTGVANTYGQTYPQPFYLRFNGDTTVSVYCLFAWIVDTGIVWHDSAIGKITNIDTLTNGHTTVSVVYPLSNDQQTFSFPDKNTLTGGSIPASPAVPSAQYTVNLNLNPATVPSVISSTWDTNLMTNSGPTSGMYEFPDINGITFISDNKMTYFRHGKTIVYTPPNQDQLLIEGYHQIGPRLLFAGYNEETDLIIQYFGVLTADGKTLLADCRDRIHTRIPNYLETIYWYGQPGMTPATTKAN